MNVICIDFSEIYSEEEFYAAFRAQANVPEHFGDNLDALYDFVSGDMELPVSVEFVEMKLEGLDLFMGIIETLEDAAETVEGFDFSYFMEQYDV